MLHAITCGEMPAVQTGGERSGREGKDGKEKQKLSDAQRTGKNPTHSRYLQSSLTEDNAVLPDLKP